MVPEKEAAGLGSDGGENGKPGSGFVIGNGSTARPGLSTHRALDALLDEESLLEDAFAMLRPGLRRPGPAACAAATVLEHLAQVRLIRRGVQAEYGL